MAPGFMSGSGESSEQEGYHSINGVEEIERCMI